MAASKFATMLQRNTNKITVALTFAVLEWTLISLLLLNSLLSFMIVKFADHFRLKPPCFWCSNLDPLFRTWWKNLKSIENTDLLCETHSREVSKLGFCETHHRLAESKGMCGECLDFGMFPWIKDLKVIHSGDDACSCCGLSLAGDSGEGKDYIVIKSSSWNQLIKEVDHVEICEKSSLEGFRVEGEEICGVKGGLVLENGIPGANLETNLGDTSKHLEFFVDWSGRDLVPVELVDFTVEEDEDRRRLEEENETDDLKEHKFAVSESMEIDEDESSLGFHSNSDCFTERKCYESTENIVEVRISDSQEHQEIESDTTVAVSEENSQMQVNETEAEVSIGTEIPDLDIVDENPTISSTSCLVVHEYHCCKEDQHQTLESVDGSGVMIEVDGSGATEVIERLKSALESERNSLQALYMELEEERSASAIAANQTMAMINRLQEEKAKVQMEALQYQRMMDEQAEYDQEALQLLNELMVKREKERQEVEKELEVYKKRVFEYEARERRRSAFSSVSCSNSDESDGLSVVELNHHHNHHHDHHHQDEKEEEGLFYNTPIDEVLNLDYEDERVAILEQLKALEEKLMNMEFEEVDEEKERPKILISSMGKSLLPLFDAISVENGDYDDTYDSNNNNNSNHSNKRFAVEEELDCLHERLLALEADREFLKHCLSSLKSGGKGMDLLQEILQHLRALRNADLRARNGCLV
ncbi:unnamed protein product [Cuscuta campestris]|uniref:GTD-binding domain-containing protein n=1 Tax=Cuscuta campestris TaxID=132261 RepID=A0A484LPC7_9ASTE|nr:unnamed protein product [Cuscuta campestris]